MEIEERFFEKDISRINSSQTFEFPSDAILGRSYSNISQVFEEVEIQRVGKNMIPFYKKRHRNGYSYMICRYCSAQISLKQQSEGVRIVSFANIHRHQMRKCKSQQQKLISQYVTGLTTQYTEYELKLLVQQKFNLNKNRLSYIMGKFRKQLNFQATEKYLNAQGWRTRKFCGEELDIPQLFLAVPPYCKDIIQLFDSIAFDVTYNLIKTKSVKHAQWGLGVFVGIGQNLQLVILGVALMCRQTKDSFIRLFSNLFDLYDAEPYTLLSDEQASLKEALIQMKDSGEFRGNQVFDSYHILKNIKKKLKKKENLKYFKYLLKAKNILEYEALFQQLAREEENEELVIRFDQNSPHCCLSRVPKSFVGLSCSSSRCEKINDLIKHTVPRQTSVFNLFHKLMRLAHNLYQKVLIPKFEVRPYELLLNDYHLKQLRESVSKKIFQKIVANYARGLKLLYIQTDVEQYSFDKRQHRIIVSRNQRLLRCSCGYNQKSGLICEHIFKILWVLKEYQYLQYINPRWIYSTKPTNPTIVQRGPGKHSRRNIHY